MSQQLCTMHSFVYEESLRKGGIGQIVSGQAGREGVGCVALAAVTGSACVAQRHRGQYAAP